jgi:AcrR family transcriptional regulator
MFASTMIDTNPVLMSTAVDMKTTRPYSMSTRARSVEETRRRILTACVELHDERLSSEIGLDHVAGRAGVSVQTVLRHFGNRAGLLDAAVRHAEEAVRAERRTPAGDVGEAVRVVVAHYEQRGDGVLLMLAQERHEPLMHRIAEQGRALHRTWVEEAFAPYLEGPDDGLLDLLVVATDVYTWKLLRRDRGLARDLTEQRIRSLVDALLEHRTAI